MWFQTNEYIKFLLTSTNQHGVHSPFVYDLVTKCFYDRKPKHSYPAIKSVYKNVVNPSCIPLKKLKLINRLVAYFDFKEVVAIENTVKTMYQILALSPSAKVSDILNVKKSYDLIFLDIQKYNSDILSLILESTHNDSLLLINNIHQSKKNYLIWKEIKNQTAVTVTIDTYDLGFVFFRKEQVKEHFIIRT
ncbi:hypothetical protein [Aquimarina pacifica]|uniref:hypothetical protein n=1 Tax=Aquimarina pacifica TaxID=1296415 RepID=UPI0004709FF6|nr:hypothetical protein [Aquimarina pacifica]